MEERYLIMQTAIEIYKESNSSLSFDDWLVYNGYIK